MTPSSKPETTEGHTAKAVDPATILFAAVWRELDRARVKFPTWPTDPLHALAVLQEEVGELQKAVLERCYEFDKSSMDDVRTEAVQTAAMALRFLASLPVYDFRPGEQHKQKVACAACDRGDFQLGHADGCAANVKDEGRRTLDLATTTDPL